jgi:hypothetical protein
MKKIVKDAIGDFRVLFDHANREYEVSPPHALRRIAPPMCEGIQRILAEGTKGDAWELLEGMAAECEKFERRRRRLRETGAESA